MTSYMFQLKPISVTLPTATPRSLTTDPTESPSTLSGTYVSSVYVGSNALRMPKRNSAPNRIATPTMTKMPDPKLTGLLAHEVRLPPLPSSAAGSACRRKNWRTYGSVAWSRSSAGLPSAIMVFVRASSMMQRSAIA